MAGRPSAIIGVGHSRSPPNCAWIVRHAVAHPSQGQRDACVGVAAEARAVERVAANLPRVQDAPPGVDPANAIRPRWPSRRPAM